MISFDKKKIEKMHKKATVVYRYIRPDRYSIQKSMNGKKDKIVTARDVDLDIENGENVLILGKKGKKVIDKNFQAWGNK